MRVTTPTRAEVIFYTRASRGTGDFRDRDPRDRNKTRLVTTGVALAGLRNLLY